MEASMVSVSGDTVVVDLWGPASATELHAVAEALVCIVRERQARGVRRASKVEARLRSVLAEAMSDTNTLRIEGRGWTITFVHCRVTSIGDEGGVESFVILSEQGVRVAVG